MNRTLAISEGRTRSRQRQTRHDAAKPEKNRAAEWILARAEVVRAC
jgi:hypothetical protein